MSFYKETTVVHNVKLLYWWEERGETPFLKPYTWQSKELVFERLVPLGDDPNRVRVETMRVPLQQVSVITFVLTDLGKQMVVKLTNGSKYTATINFPQTLKRGADTGFADYEIYAVGESRQGADVRNFRMALKKIKTIKIVGIDMNAQK